MRERPTERQAAPIGRRGSTLLFALLFGTVLSLAMLVPVGPATRGIATAFAHADLLQADPQPGTTLQDAPRIVHLWFSEDLNTQNSHVRVYNAADSSQVDRQDSTVLTSDPRQMTVSLGTLSPGNYLIVYTTQSADDGHVTSDGYLFSYAPAGVTIPTPGAARLPTNSAVKIGNGTLDAPTLALTITTWLTFVFLAFWVGGVIWETWILAPGLTADSSLTAAAYAAERRFRRLAPYALGLLTASDVGIVLAQMGALSLAEGRTGAFSLTVANAILFGSRFGQFWWVRQAVAIAALALTLVSARNRWPMRQTSWSTAGMEEALTVDDASGVPDFKRALLHTMVNTKSLPKRLVAGVRHRSWVGHVELLLALTLLLAFMLSGHAAASADKALLAASVDILHLVANSAWVGGLFYISLVLVPALSRLTPRQRARVMAIGLPQFGALAIVAATLLAATGSLNTTVRLTSLSQFVTTAYGWTLLFKIELFLLMVGISAFHAFVLRPRLAHTLAKADLAAMKAAAIAKAAAPQLAAAGGRRGKKANGRSPAPLVAGDPPARVVAERAPPQAQALVKQLSDWLLWEAVIGAAVLLCVALLSAFAGTLAAVPTSTGLAGVRQSGAQATVAVVRGLTSDTASRDSVQLQEAGPNQPGVYTGTMSLSQPGVWRVTVRVVPPANDQVSQAVFDVTLKQ